MTPLSPDVSMPARVFAAAIALAAGLGLAIQFGATFGRSGSMVETVSVMLRYFTVLANLLTAVLFTGIAAGARRFATPSLVGGITLAMLLVGIVYAVLLRGLLVLSGGDRIADLLLHTVTPLLVPAFWLVCAHKGRLTPRDPWLWALLPLAYFVYALARGAAEGTYPYPFMNVTELGWARTLINAGLLACGVVAAGFLLLWLDRRLAGREA
jgi:hypothetical protein